GLGISAVAVRNRIFRIESYRLVIIANSAIVIALPVGYQSAVVISVRIFGIQADRFLKIAHRKGALALVHQRKAAGVVGGGELRIQTDRFVAVSHGAVVIADCLVVVATVEIKHGLARNQVYRLADVADRRGIVSLSLIADAPQIMGGPTLAGG